MSDPALEHLAVKAYRRRLLARVKADEDSFGLARLAPGHRVAGVKPAVKQVQEWLGHADAGFTLRTYVHLMDDGIGEADFLDGAVRANTGSTACTETAANRAVLVAAETAD